MRFGAASVAAHFDPECDGWRSSAHVSQLACGALFGEEASISARKHGRNGDGGGGVGSSAGVLSVCVHTVTRAGRPKIKKEGTSASDSRSKTRSRGTPSSLARPRQCVPLRVLRETPLVPYAWARLSASVSGHLLSRSTPIDRARYFKKSGVHQLWCLKSGTEK